MRLLSLAQKSGLDQRTITFIENGVNVPSVVILFVICRVLGKKVATVVGMRLVESLPQPTKSAPPA